MDYHKNYYNLSALFISVLNEFYLPTKKRKSNSGIGICHGENLASIFDSLEWMLRELAKILSKAPSRFPGASSVC